MAFTYNPGNYAKYMSANPLKRYAVSRLNATVLFHLKKTLTAASAPVKILDAGCGEGFIDRLMLELLDPSRFSLTGLEYTSEALAIAREMNPKVHYLQGDITKMPFKANEFDVSICTEVLEHLEHPELALKELERVTARQILITVPHEPYFRLCNLATLHNVTRLGNTIDHINNWTASGLQKFITQTCPNLKWTFGGCFPWSVAIGEKTKK